LSQSHRQRPEPGADLQDPRAPLHARQLDDPAGEGGLDQEVLAEGLPRPDPMSLGEGAQGAGREVRRRASTTS
jgi:hypothetical protein